MVNSLPFNSLASFQAVSEGVGVLLLLLFLPRLQTLRPGLKDPR